MNPPCHPGVIRDKYRSINPAVRDIHPKGPKIIQIYPISNIKISKNIKMSKTIPSDNKRIFNIKK